MDRREAFRRLADSRVARLATADAGGIPHVVPCVMAVEGDTVYSAVDAKPKRSRRLKRLANIRANPNAEMVADHYSEDWRELWWVRVGGSARILEGGSEFDRALSLLAAKYAQYSEDPPAGPVIALDVVRWSAWEASPSA